MIYKRKNNINVYSQKELTDRRQELLDKITKSDTNLPDSVLHDDLDFGMLNYVSDNLKVVSDGEQIPVIKKILTIQRWGEISSNWSFSDEDGNIKLPFIAVIRKPDVQPGTNPMVQRTIPDRKTFYYQSVLNWDGNKMGADIYKIPQPVAVDISYDITIVCQKFRDLNRFNKIVLQKFSSRQSYTTVKGHYIPIVLDRISDNSPIDTIDGRKFYMQNYEFTMLGFLLDEEEFEVKPAINRTILLTEFVDTKPYTKKVEPKSIKISTVTFVGDGEKTIFSVGESISYLFYVALNGLILQKGVDYYHISGTSNITFTNPPLINDRITVVYYSNPKNLIFIDENGRILNLKNEYFTYDGLSLIFTLQKPIIDIIHVETNGLIEEEGVGYIKLDDNNIQYLYPPVVNSVIGITYLY